MVATAKRTKTVRLCQLFARGIDRIITSTNNGSISVITDRTLIAVRISEQPDLAMELNDDFGVPTQSRRVENWKSRDRRLWVVIYPS